MIYDRVLARYSRCCLDPHTSLRNSKIRRIRDLKTREQELRVPFSIPAGKRERPGLGASMRVLLFILLILIVATSADSQHKSRGSIVEHDAEVTVKEPGPHNGGGETVAYKFFTKADGFRLAFRKRALKPGSAIGHHPQNEDEVYYVLSGRGMMTLDDKTFEVGPGTAILTRPGSSHALKQTGAEDLVILITYEEH